MTDTTRVSLSYTHTRHALNEMMKKWPVGDRIDGPGRRIMSCRYCGGTTDYAEGDYVDAVIGFTHASGCPIISAQEVLLDLREHANREVEGPEASAYSYGGKSQPAEPKRRQTDD